MINPLFLCVNVLIYLWGSHVHIQLATNQQSNHCSETRVGFHHLRRLAFNNEGAGNESTLCINSGDEVFV